MNEPSQVMVNTEKLKDALLELQYQRSMLDVAIADIQKVLAMLGNGWDVNALKNPTCKQVNAKRNYIFDSVLVLESAGHPLNLDQLAAGIGDLRGGNKKIPRTSLESSLSRHLSDVKPSMVIRVGPGTYGLPAG